MITAWTDFLHQQGYTLAATAATLNTGDHSTDSAACYISPLPQLGLLQASGADAASYLHNLVSNEVTQLAADAVVWNSLNTPKGRMIANFLLWPESGAESTAAEAEPTLNLLVSADLLAGLHKRLSMYILRSKVKLQDHSSERVVFALGGDGAAALLTTCSLPCPDADMQHRAAGAVRVLRLAADHFLLIAEAQAAPTHFAALRAAGAHAADSSRWQLQLIRAGLPLLTEPTREEFVAQMLNFELIGGVNFKKGCYPGQEIVARAQYLGKVKRRMYRLAGRAEPLPVAGAEICTADAQPVGKLVNVAPLPDGSFEALAVLQSASLDPDAPALQLAAQHSASLQQLPLPYALP